jgi:hypothetical protein
LLVDAFVATTRRLIFKNHGDERKLQLGEAAASLTLMKLATTICERRRERPTFQIVVVRFLSCFFAKHIISESNQPVEGEKTCCIVVPL